MEIEIRQLARGEAALAADLFDAYRVFYGLPRDPEAAGRYLDARLRAGESVVFLACHRAAGEPLPLGFVQLYPVYSSLRLQKDWVLNDLYVDPHYRQQKIGERLVTRAVDFARQAGAATIRLATAPDNRVARQLYEKLAFRRLEKENKYDDYQLALTVHAG